MNILRTPMQVTFPEAAPLVTDDQGSILPRLSDVREVSVSNFAPGALESDGEGFNLPPTKIYMRYTDAENMAVSPTSEPHPMIPARKFVAVIVGSVIGGVVLLGACFLLICLYRRRKQRESNPYPMGPLQASLPMSREAFTSPKFSHYGISFSPSTAPSTESLTPLPYKHPESWSRRSDAP